MYAVLSPESAAEPGRWKTIPYQKGIMDAVTDRSVEMITVMKSARVGYTKIVNHTIGYFIEHDPCPMMVVQPTIEDAQGYSKDEIQPMLRDTPVLTGLVSEAKTRNSSNTIMKKTFPGGQLLLTGANSARGFRRVSVRVIMFDEVDGYPPTAGQEGDQIKLGIMRTNYFHNRKIILGSTPTMKGFSRIEASYEISDKRRYYVPCPHCKKRQHLVWEQIDYTRKGTIDNPVYVCLYCGKAITYDYHRFMIERGEWREERPFRGHAGFHIWAAYSYSPNSTWKQIVKEYLECLDENGKAIREKMKTWVNVVRGETFEDDVEKLNAEVLYESRETYEVEVPLEAVVLTAGVDIQDNRIEVSVIGWGEQFEAWVITHEIIYGDLAQRAVQEELDCFRKRLFAHESGQKLSIACTCIDTGYKTQAVYGYIEPRQKERVYAIKGASTSGAPVVKRPKKVKNTEVNLFIIGTDTAKDAILSTIKMGRTHFPAHLPLSYFNQLTSESVQVFYKQGFPCRRYIKDPLRNNEALDTFVYAYAAVVLLNPAFAVLAGKLAGNTQTQEKKQNAQKKTPIEKQERTVSRRKPNKKTNFVTGWKQ